MNIDERSDSAIKLYKDGPDDSRDFFPKMTEGEAAHFLAMAAIDMMPPSKEADEPPMDIPQGEFEKFGQAIADLRAAIYEHHPYFVLARKLSDWWVAHLPASEDE